MFLEKFFGIGNLDLQFIEDYYAVVENSTDFEELNNLTLSEVNANTIINKIFSCINRKVFLSIREKIENNHFVLPQKFNKKRPVIKNKLLESCDKRINEFLPFINCIDSWFRNEIDEVDLSKCDFNNSVTDVFNVFVKNIIE